MAPAETTRLSAREILDRVIADAFEELRRPPAALAFSALFAGLTIGFSALGVAGALHVLGPGPTQEFVAALLFPIGFLAVILGRAQFFTENTLYPVVLVLRDRRHLRATGRLWAIVYAANTVGAAAFGVLVAATGALPSDYVGEVAAIGVDATSGSYGANFWSAVIGGWMIATVAWLVAASQWTIGQFMVIFSITFLLGLGHFDHCVVTTGEAVVALIEGDLGGGRLAAWLAVVTAGNIVGGVGIVALLNYAQVAADRPRGARGDVRP